MQQPIIQLANNVQMPQFGLGVWEAEDGNEVQTAVSEALAAGYRAIDTAKIYGNEEGVGRAINESAVPREDIFLTTKLWNSDHGYDKTLAAFDESLKKLGTDYVDLYLVHWPVPSDGLMEETWRAMEDIYKSGRAKAIGVSNFQPQHLHELMKTATILPMVDQVELHPRLQQRELRDYCEDKDIVITAWSPLLRGGELLENEVIKKIAVDYNKTPAQVILRWHIQLGHVVIPKSVTPERIRENLDIFDFELSGEAMAAINDLETGEHAFEYTRSFIE